jgi:hypothetical protein
MGFNVGNFLSNAAKTVGKPVGGAVHLIGKTPVGAAVRLTESGASAAGKLAGNALRSVPVIGKPLDDVYDLNLQPFKVAANVLAGHNIKQSVLEGLGKDIEDAEGARPLIKVVLNIFVPGSGTAASAAIGAGYQLYKNKVLSPGDIVQLSEAAVGTGNAIGSGAFNLAQSTMSGTDPAQGAAVLAKIAGVPGAAPAITQGLSATKGLSDGTTSEADANTAMSGLENALKGAPASTVKSVLDGVHAGLTVGQAQKLQSSMKSGLSTILPRLQTPPSPLTPEETALLSNISADERSGLVVGLNVARTVATASQLSTIRDLLPNSKAQDGYDAALANHTGAVTNAPPPSLPPVARAGYLVHRGIQGSDSSHIRNVLKVLPPAASPGVALSRQSMGVEWVKGIGGATAGGFAGLKIAGLFGAVIGGALGWFAGTRL